jgi:hypothetical protein
VASVLDHLVLRGHEDGDAGAVDERECGKVENHLVRPLTHQRSEHCGEIRRRRHVQFPGQGDERFTIAFSLGGRERVGRSGLGHAT